MKDLILFNTAHRCHIFRTFSAVPRQSSGKHLNLLLMNQFLTHGNMALSMVYNLFNESDIFSFAPTGYFSIFQNPLYFPNLAQIAIFCYTKPRTAIIGCWRLGLWTVGEAVKRRICKVCLSHLSPPKQFKEQEC